MLCDRDRQPPGFRSLPNGHCRSREIGIEKRPGGYSNLAGPTSRNFPVNAGTAFRAEIIGDFPAILTITHIAGRHPNNPYPLDRPIRTNPARRASPALAFLTEARED